MKKLLIVAALGIFASCGNGAANDAVKDSLKSVDSMAKADKANVDASAKAQKNTIDSFRRLTDAQIDSGAAAKMDSLKRKDTVKRK